MSQRNPQRRASTQVKTAPQPKANGNASTATRTRPTTTTTRTTEIRSPKSQFRNLPLEGHRLLATIGLIALLLVTLLPSPGSGVAPSPAAFITPGITGTGSVPGDVALGTGTIDQFTALFPYRSLSERSAENLSTVWPEAADYLSYEPNSLRARRALVGQLFASSSGNINVKVKESGLEANPPQEKLEAIVFAFSDMESGGDAELAGRGITGRAAMVLVRSLTIAPSARANTEQVALSEFQDAINTSPQTWQLTYNWGIANMLLGNYAAAYEGMRGVRFAAQNDNNIWPHFWMGVAAVREGKPIEAINAFRETLQARIADDANTATRDQFDEVQRLAREGLADAQWANRTPAEAYNTYLDLIKLGRSGIGVYNKWLRLGIQQHAYESLVRDMRDIYALGDLESGLLTRVHHDRARILSFLGRHGEAIEEYKLAAGISQNDARLLVSYAQALESSGDHNGALGQAELAMRALGRDPQVVDLTSVASTAVVTNATTVDQLTGAQHLLDATLVRARAWGNTGQMGLVDTIVGQTQAQAASAPAGEAGLLNLYSAFMYEAAGEATKARDNYRAAWDRLKDLPAGQPGRAAALAGLARTDGAIDGPSKGIETLNANGYNLANMEASTVKQLGAPDVLTQASILFRQAGQQSDAANALRLAAIARNLADADALTGVGRTLWAANGTVTPASGMLAVGDDLRRLGGDTSLAKLRYKQAYGLDPALAPAFNNLGILHAQNGNNELARFYMQASTAVSPGYIWGAQNLASYAYKQGLGNFATGERAQAAVVKAAGPGAASWGYEVRPDERGLVPAPYNTQRDFLGKIPAFLLIALLLAHTIVGRDRTTNHGLIPTKGVLGTVGHTVDARVREAVPALATARKGSAGALMSIALPALIGMLALAWHAGRGWLEVALAFLPVALLAAIIAFAANEIGQWVAARRNRGTTLHHTTPFGVLLGVVGVPFGVMYGWGATTRVQPETTVAADGKSGRGTSTIGRRNVVESDLVYEAQLEALADEGTGTVPRSSDLAHTGGTGGRAGLSKAATIMLAGLLANLVLGLVFGLAYLLTGWQSLRLVLLASMLVLTFTAVSEPPADGWTLFRRNPALWLALFLFGATMSVLLIAGLI